MVTLLHLVTLAACVGKDTPVPGETGDTSIDTGDTADSPDTGDSVDTADSDTSETGDSDTGDTGDSTTTPNDADGDGHDAPAYGGDDCDDRDATVFPGAQEWCDTMDHDCDGEALAPGVCGVAQGFEATGVPLLSYTSSDEFVDDIGLLGDLDGDGLGEIITTCRAYCGTHRTSVQVLPGGIPEEPLTLPDDNLETWEVSAESYLAESADPAGEVDGDGFEDVAFVVTDGGRGLYVDLGPFALGGESISAYDVDLIYCPDSTGKAWGGSRVSGVDFDGDGRTDFALSPSSHGDEEGVSVDLIFGGTDLDEVVSILGDSTQPVRLGDLDGDGVEELLLRDSSWNLAWVSGSDLRGADRQPMDDLVEGSFETLRTDGTAPYLTFDWANVGDWDDDGHPEIVTLSPYHNEAWDSTHEILFFGGDLTGYHEATDALGVLRGGADCDARELCGTQFVSLDFDGDGILDLATDATRTVDGGYYTYLYPGNRGIPAPGTELDDTLIHWEAIGLNGLATGDVNADGYEDLIGSSAGIDDVQTILGWDVPWDDPTYW